MQTTAAYFHVWCIDSSYFWSYTHEAIKCFPPVMLTICAYEYDDVIKWTHFPRHWPFVMGIHRSPVESPHKGNWRRALVFSLICARTNGWANNRDAGDLGRHVAYYDVTEMKVCTVAQNKTTTKQSKVCRFMKMFWDINCFITNCWYSFSYKSDKGEWNQLTRNQLDGSTETPTS